MLREESKRTPFAVLELFLVLAEESMIKLISPGSVAKCCILRICDDFDIFQNGYDQWWVGLNVLLDFAGLFSH